MWWITFINEIVLLIHLTLINEFLILINSGFKIYYGANLVIYIFSEFRLYFLEHIFLLWFFIYFLLFIFMLSLFPLCLTCKIFVSFIDLFQEQLLVYLLVKSIFSWFINFCFFKINTFFLWSLCLFFWLFDMQYSYFFNF